MVWDEQYDRLITAAMQQYRGLVEQLCGSSRDWEDIFQDLRVAVFRKLSSGDGKSYAVSTRIFQICRSELLSHVRKERRRGVLVGWLPLEEAVLSASEDIVASVLSEVHREWLLDRVACFLSERYPEDAAAVLAHLGDGEPLSIPYSRFYTILRALRSYLRGIGVLSSGGE